MTIIPQTHHSDFQSEQKSGTERQISYEFTNRGSCLKVQIIETDSRIMVTSGWLQASGEGWAGSQRIQDVSQMEKKFKKGMAPIPQCTVHLKFSLLYYFSETVACAPSRPQTQTHTFAICKDILVLPALLASPPKCLDSRCAPA